MKIMHKRRKAFYTLLVIVILLVGVRLYLPTLVKNYVNRILSELPEHQGSISGVELSLIQGSYKIEDMVITKRGNAAASDPLFAIPVIHLSVQWSALRHGRIVGEIEAIDPEMNILMVDGASDKSGSQTGADVDWTKPIKEIMPLQINRFSISNGKVAYKDPAQDPAIDIFIDDLELTATNFSNTEDSDHPLPSKIVATGSSIGGGQMYLTTRLNALKKIPDLDYEFKFEGIQLTALNDFTKAYSAIDFESGTMDMYSEMAVKNGNIEGYFKPVMNSIDIIDLKEDIKNPLTLIWEGFASLVSEIFENQKTDQFATKVPISGNLNSPGVKVWPTVINVLKNAFIEAFKKQVDGTIDFESANVESANTESAN
jgi:hypothetical protein